MSEPALPAAPAGATRSLSRSRSLQRHPSSHRSIGRRRRRDSHLARDLYTHSYLIFFSILGTLARVGLQALTFYPGAPVSFTVLWANVGGSFVMGFLAEDRAFFHHRLATESQEAEVPEAQPVDEAGAEARPGPSAIKEERASGEEQAAARKAHMAAKKAIPLYIGLSTGFCGSFTSFSTFIRDMFLAASNDLPNPSLDPSPSRSGGSSFLAVLAVLISTVALSLSALVAGAHFAASLRRWTPSLPFVFMRNYLDPAVVFLGWGCWLGAVFLAIFPPENRWRGEVVFGLVFAPLGTILRYHLAVRLNTRVPAFPLGTFAANIFGTGVLGMAWDLSHAPVGSVAGCQVLSGIQDGFCGCLTTVSTWVAEMASLRRMHAYTYGAGSVVVAFALLIAVMGGMRWGHGFETPVCAI